MDRLYACIASGEDKAALISIAEKFAYNIELQDDTVLFDVSGLHRSIGCPAEIAERISDELRDADLTGNVAVSRDAGSAVLYARSRPGVTVSSDDLHVPLPLDTLELDPDTLHVLKTLGIKTTEDLRAVPENELLARYGESFGKVIDLVNERSGYVLTPNLKENTATWSYELDLPIAEAERLVFLLGRGLSRVFAQSAQLGFSVEHVDITFVLDNRSSKRYEIKTSFPSLDKAFWLKLIDLRIAGDPPESEICSVALTCHFTRPRTVQSGLYSATKPESERLLLTVSKIKKAVGEENVGVPILLDQRLPKGFALDPEKLPVGKEHDPDAKVEPVLSISYFEPPLHARVTIQSGVLTHLRTKLFGGRVVEYGGVWKGSSQWWNRSFWRTHLWDVELDNRKVYRLSKSDDGWYVIGEYD
jgi:protein ImuB